MESKKSKAGLLLGLAGTGLQGFKAFKANTVKGGTALADREMVDMAGAAN